MSEQPLQLSCDDDRNAPTPGALGTLNDETVVGNDLADRARGVPAKPPVGQTPPVGSSAHSAPSQPFAECAPEIGVPATRDLCVVGSSGDHPNARKPRALPSPIAQNRRNLGALALGPPGADASLASRASAPAPPPPEFHGTTVHGTHPGLPGGQTPGQVLDLDQIVDRVLAANRVIERISEPCPQGDDCAGDGKHTRIFDCEEGCGFRGCVVCLMVHEAEPHWSDSDTAREMYREIGRSDDRVIG